MKPHSAAPPSKFEFERPLRTAIDLEDDPKVLFQKFRAYLSGKIDREELNEVTIDLLLKQAPLPGSKGIQITVENLIDILEYRVRRGDKGAITALVNAAVAATRCLKSLTLEKPTIFKTLAKEMIEWPSMVSFHSDWASENATIVSKLELGKHSPWRKKLKISKLAAAKQPFREVIHSYCLKMVEILEVLREYHSFLKETELRRSVDFELANLDEKFFSDAAKLKPLSFDTADSWFNVGWEMLLYFSDKRPERLPGLGKVGLHRQFHQTNLSGEPGPGSKRSNIRDGLKSQLRRAFLLRFGKKKGAKKAAANTKKNSTAPSSSPSTTI